MVALASGGEAARWVKRLCSFSSLLLLLLLRVFMAASVLRSMQKKGGEERARQVKRESRRARRNIPEPRSNAAAFNNLYTCGETQMLQVVVIQEGDLLINREEIWEYQRSARELFPLPSHTGGHGGRGTVSGASDGGWVDPPPHHQQCCCCCTVTLITCCSQDGDVNVSMHLYPRLALLTSGEF